MPPLSRRALLLTSSPRTTEQTALWPSVISSTTTTPTLLFPEAVVSRASTRPHTRLHILRCRRRQPWDRPRCTDLMVLVQAVLLLLVDLVDWVDLLLLALPATMEDPHSHRSTTPTPSSSSRRPSFGRAQCSQQYARVAHVCASATFNLPKIDFRHEHARDCGLSAARARERASIGSVFWCSLGCAFRHLQPLQPFTLVVATAVHAVVPALASYFSRPPAPSSNPGTPGSSHGPPYGFSSGTSLSSHGNTHSNHFQHPQHLHPRIITMVCRDTSLRVCSA